MDIENFQIHSDASIKDALKKIDANQHGVVLLTDATGSVSALATDGDVRRQLLAGAHLEDAIELCANQNFIWADVNTPRELLLKQLDSRIKLIPVLDSKKRLIRVVSKEHMPVENEAQIYARAKSPVRISFGGGGSDLTHFFSEDTGAVINSTISLYSHATLKQRADGKIYIRSADLGMELLADDLDDAMSKSRGFELILAIIKTIHPDFGFELYIHSDFPMNSGLGGSSVVASAVLGCFNQFRRDKWDLHELAELAFQAERLYVGIAGGWQDQYATVFGGFNFMEFQLEQNVVHPLRIPTDVMLELEESLVLADTGIAHASGDIHVDQKQQMSRTVVLQNVQRNVALTYKIRNHLLRGRMLQFGEALHEAWELKKGFSARISSNALDDIYQNAIEAGAVGGKLLGAGGGGFFLFYVPPFKKLGLMRHLEDAGLRVQPFRFEPEGLRAWSVREARSQPLSETL